jgi:hypothetical protein
MLLIEMDRPKGSDSIGSAGCRDFACIYMHEMEVELHEIKRWNTLQVEQLEKVASAASMAPDRRKIGRPSGPGATLAEQVSALWSFTNLCAMFTPLTFPFLSISCHAIVYC